MRIREGDMFVVDDMITVVQKVEDETVRLTVPSQNAWPFPTWLTKTKAQMKKYKRHRPVREEPEYEEAPF